MTRITIIAILFAAAFMSGFLLGRSSETSKQDKAANAAFQNSEDVQNEVNQLNPYDSCLSIGRVPEQCKVLMRRIDKTTEGE